MVKAQCRVLLLAAVLAIGVVAAPRAQATSGGPLHVSVDLRDAPFEEALRQLFSGQMLRLANYVVESEPPDGTRATAKVTRMMAPEALTTVLSQYGMTYRWVGHTIWISREVVRQEPERRLIVYLRRNGDRTQLRLRAYPYESGGEKLLWESRKDVIQFAHCLPSPSFKYAAVSWYGGTYDETGEGGPWLLLIPLAGGDAKRIGIPRPVSALLWTEDDELEIVERDGAQWRFHPSTGRLTAEPVAGDEALEAAHGAQVQALEALLSKVRLPTVFPVEPLDSIVQAEAWGSPGPRRPPLAAVSPDGRYAALVGAEAAVYIVDAATGAVRQKIHPTRLVHTEAVAVGQLHWSQDSGHLLFAESHLHAARFHGKGGSSGRMPSATDWTELVREYSLATDQTETLTVGYDAYLVPTEAASELLAGSHPRDWQSADDQRRWGRYARDDSE
jgi:hypothetical protein